jgi:signal transduction histidine kinase
MPPDRWEWPLRKYWIDIAWMLFAVANLGGMLLFPAWETVPFHFIWVSLTVLYGFRVWRVRPTALALSLVMISTALVIGIDVGRGDQPIDELTEVPLMAAMFLAMVWHARRRLSAMERIEQVSEENAKLLDRERRFLQDASHQLGTPITVALGHIELIERTSHDPAILGDARVVDDELLRLRRLANRLLLLAAADAPDFLHRVPLEVEPLLLEALRRWAPTARRWALGPIEPMTVDADPDRLSLALDALMENAVEHTEAEDRIGLSACREGGMAVIAVADSGTGIPTEDLPRIFDRFARVDPSRRREAGGFGLGLPIVKAIAEAHGGAVRVRSLGGKGSRFELLLPVTSAEQLIHLPPAEARVVEERLTGPELPVR